MAEEDKIEEYDVEAFAGAGKGMKWSVTARDKDGNLMGVEFMIEPPAPPKCARFGCLFKFVMDSLFYALLQTYNRRRLEYAYSHKGEILERYRTGYPQPKNIWQAIHANIKLGCPVCRRYDVDPLLGGSK